MVKIRFSHCPFCSIRTFYTVHLARATEWVGMKTGEPDSWGDLAQFHVLPSLPRDATHLRYSRPRVAKDRVPSDDFRSGLEKALTGVCVQKARGR